MRSEVLEGVYIVFSSVIPLDTNPESTEIWRLAHVFGAKCHTELSTRTTHVVAAKVGVSAAPSFHLFKAAYRSVGLLKSTRREKGAELRLFGFLG
jgi:hypothetical protein